MAAQTFCVLPTTDIHLVSSISQMSSFSLDTLISANGNVVDMTKLSYSDFNPNIVTVTKDTVHNKTVITALADGHTMCRVRYSDGGITHECLLSISIHPGVSKFWLGSDKITIHTGASYHGYVVSVFAKFSDNEIADITYHPYLSYVPDGISTNTNKCTVSNHIIKSTTAVTGNSSVQTKISISLNGLSSLPAQDVNVDIKKAFNSKREILEKVYKGISTSTHVNILILSDGFLNKADFEIYRTMLVQQLTENSLFSPYHLVRDNMTIWSAFEPSNDMAEGITVSHAINTEDSYYPDLEEGSGNYLYQLINLVGLPNSSSPANLNDALASWASIPGFVPTSLTLDVFNAWKSKNTIKGFVATKDTEMGISIGKRLGDKIESTRVGTTPQSVYAWYRPTQQQRIIEFDRRRYPQKNHMAYGAFANKIILAQNATQPTIQTSSPLDTYFSSLKYLDSSLSTPSNGTEYNIGNNWNIIGKDRRLVIFLCNHYKAAGQSIVSGWIVPSPVNKAFYLGGVGATLGTRKDYVITSGSIITEKLNDNVNTAVLSNEIDKFRVVSTFAHELMHALGLKDEYEGGETRTIIQNQNDKDNVDSECNTCTFDKIMKAGTDPLNKKIDPDKIKWNFRRIAFSSMTITDATNTGLNITVKVEPFEASKWKSIKDYKDATNNPVVLPLYLRSGLYDPSEPGLFFELKIEQITNITGNIITLKVDSSDSSKITNNIGKLKQGSCIYMPKRYQNDYDPSKPELRLINPRVFEYLHISNLSFAPSYCAVGYDGPEFPESDSNINLATTTASSIYPEFSSPKNRFLVTAIYEGGAVWNCNVFRGNGWSILRQILMHRHFSLFNVDSPDLDPLEAPKSSSEMTTVYAAFDMIAKYYLVSIIYPTALEKLDSLEYKITDNTDLSH
ncbi:hypothetical protein IC235_18425 [Hymenobacter sp. BT664]|uniref:Uncharacterized protein n=1 Tax=Hymenobacter montanus TaxID=2771359 RepID=A0A927GKV5_9BACT|nr:hypothetical protein [Hymenobacter montanus]MBD2769870.1 hypothetical protein [Hymenobacter montanus]